MGITYFKRDNMFKKLLLPILISLSFISCSSDYDKKLKISATTWIGYTPLFYAKEKGWLDELNIKLLNVSSLSENMYLYKAGKSDAYVGTQYEYGVLSNANPSLKPIMMFDRSYGGDVIMSNASIEDLQNETSPIDAYLEMDSINNTLIKDFISKYKLQNKEINYINKDQTFISLLDVKDINKKVIIVTYVPYDNELKKHGFQEIASTKDGLDLLVIDAMFTKTKTFNAHEKQFRELKKLVDRGIDILKSDPEGFFNVIKPYMLEMKYEEFKDSLGDIIWINKDLSPELKKRMLESDISTRDLI